MPPRKPGTEARLKAVKATEDQEALIAALDDPAPVIIEAAAKRIRWPKAAGALLRTYLRLHEGAPEADPGCWARMALIEALGRLEAPEGEEAARLAIRSVQVEAVGFGLADTATGLRVAAASLLANLRVPGALLDLAWLLYDTEPNANCSDRERPFAKLATRVAAAKAIGALGDPSGAAVLALKLAFPDGELADVLAECMDGLAALEEPRIRELLQPWLEHTNPYLSVAAAQAIAQAEGEKAVPLLLEMLGKAEKDAKEPLVYALASIRAEAARTALRELTRHPDKVIRAVAQQVI